MGATTSLPFLAVPTIEVHAIPTANSWLLDLTRLPAGSYHVDILDLEGHTLQAATLQAGHAHVLDTHQVAHLAYAVHLRGRAADGSFTLIAQNLT